MADVLAVRNQYRLTQWAQIISECQASGMSNRRFCEERGISEKTYYYWLRRMRVMATEQATPELIRLESPKKYEVEAERETSIKIRYHEAQLEIPSGMDSATIEAVLTSIKTL